MCFSSSDSLAVTGVSLDVDDARLGVRLVTSCTKVEEIGPEAFPTLESLVEDENRDESFFKSAASSERSLSELEESEDELVAKSFCLGCSLLCCFVDERLLPLPAPESFEGIDL